MLRLLKKLRLWKMPNINEYTGFLRETIKTQEGYKDTPYKDQIDTLTIGIGHNLNIPLSMHIIEHLFTEDLQKAIKTVKIILSDKIWHNCNKSQQVALTSMAFQLGNIKMSRFKRFIKNMKSFNIEGAVLEMRDSLWYTQTPKRIEELIVLLRKDK